MKVSTRIYILFTVVVALTMNCTSVNLEASQAESPESTVSIEFEEGDGNVGPLDPEEPGNPGDGGTGESGPLALNYVSNFYFEKEEILTRYAEYPTTTQRPYIQVTDARGTGEGWSVSARASKFETASGKESLFGASMTLKNASCVSPTPELPPPQPKESVTLKFSGADLVEVVSAMKDTGMGTWLTRWYTDPDATENYSVILEVPASSGMKGVNVATITWILGALPA